MRRITQIAIHLRERPLSSKMVQLRAAREVSGRLMFLLSVSEWETMCVEYTELPFFSHC